MSHTEMAPAQTREGQALGFKLEVVVVPVTDVDRAKRFHTSSATTRYDGAQDLAKALRRAAHAHGEHEARTGQEDPDWPDWYAEYMVRDRVGEELPS